MSIQKRNSFLPVSVFAFSALLLCGCARDGETPASANDAESALPPQSPKALAPAAPFAKSHSVPRFDRRTGIVFPAGIEGLRMVDWQDPIDPRQVLRVRYVAASPGAPALDVAIYPGDASKTLKDGADSPDLKREFNAALSDFAGQGLRGELLNLSFGRRQRIELATSDPAKPCSALSARLRYSLKDGSPAESLLLTTVCKGFFLKASLSSKRSQGFDDFAARVSLALGKLLYKSSAAIATQDEKNSVFSALKALEEDPLGLGSLAAPALLSFVKSREDLVFVRPTPATLPWIDANERLGHQELLLAAYVGGNAASQLRESKREDSPLDGLRCVLRVYSKIKEAEPSFISPSIEKLLKLEQAGRLQDALLSDEAFSLGKGAEK